MRTARRQLVVLPVALVLAAGLAGCAGRPSADAARPTSGPTASYDAAANGPFVLTEANFADLGAQVAGASSYKLTGTIAVQDQSIYLTGAVSGSDADLTETVPSAADPVHLKVVDGQVYVNLGGATGEKYWQADPSTPLGKSLSSATGQADVADTVAQQQDAIVSVTPSGEPETFEGMSAQPYDVVLDTAKALGDQAAAAAARGVSIPSTLTYTYWVGDDGLPRKISSNLLGTSTELYLTQWGTPVTIAAPTADEITEDQPTV